jgi:hypothetical protein
LRFAQGQALNVGIRQELTLNPRHRNDGFVPSLALPAGQSRSPTSVRFRVRHPSWYVTENGVKRQELLVPDLLKRLLPSSHLHLLGCANTLIAVKTALFIFAGYRALPVRIIDAFLQSIGHADH